MEPEKATHEETSIGLWRVAGIFLRIGNLTFGGGDPTMAALQRELVDKRRWLTTEKYALSYSLARITPGTNVLAFSAGSAWYLRGWPGAVACVVASTVPCSLIAVWLTQTFATAGNRWALGATAAILAAVVGMVGAGAWLLVRPQWRAGNRWRTAAILALSVVLTFGLKASPIVVLAAAALLGAVWQEGA